EQLVTRGGFPACTRGAPSRRPPPRARVPAARGGRPHTDGRPDLAGAEGGAAQRDRAAAGEEPTAAAALLLGGADPGRSGETARPAQRNAQAPAGARPGDAAVTAGAAGPGAGGAPAGCRVGAVCRVGIPGGGDDTGRRSIRDGGC